MQVFKVLEGKWISFLHLNKLSLSPPQFTVTLCTANAKP
jgi:hypothetical protein